MLLFSLPSRKQNVKRIWPIGGRSAGILSPTILGFALLVNGEEAVAG